MNAQKTLVLFILLISSSLLYSQGEATDKQAGKENIEPNECLTQNAITLYSILEDGNQTKLINSLLDNDYQLIVTFDVDEFGSPLRIRSIKSELELDDAQIKNLKKMIREAPQTTFCKEKILIERFDRTTITISFPYALMSEYDLYKAKNKKATKQSYLKEQLKKYKK